MGCIFNLLKCYKLQQAENEIVGEIQYLMVAASYKGHRVTLCGIPEIQIIADLRLKCQKINSQLMKITKEKNQNYLDWSTITRNKSYMDRSGFKLNRIGTQQVSLLLVKHINISKNLIEFNESINSQPVSAESGYRKTPEPAIT